MFIDETGINTKMTRLYGRAPRGERLVASAPFGHWKTTTFVAGLRLDGLTAPWLIEGAMDGDAFRTYVRKVLAPTLEPGDIVVMDNLPSHKVAGIEQAIAEQGAQIYYLPPYSPDLNPIERVFAKLKQLMRSLNVRAVGAITDAVASILDRFAADECAAYFRKAGYQHSI